MKFLCSYQNSNHASAVTTLNVDIDGLRDHNATRCEVMVALLPAVHHGKTPGHTTDTHDDCGLDSVTCICVRGNQCLHRDAPRETDNPPPRSCLSNKARPALVRDDSTYPTLQVSLHEGSRHNQFRASELSSKHPSQHNLKKIWEF